MLPIELISIIIGYTGTYKMRNHDIVRQIPRDDVRYHMLFIMPRVRYSKRLNMVRFDENRRKTTRPREPNEYTDDPVILYPCMLVDVYNNRVVYTYSHRMANAHYQSKKWTRI